MKVFSSILNKHSSLDTSFSLEENENKHIIFLLHGYMSDADDLTRIYSAIRIKCKKTSIHGIKSIENITDKGIFELGKIVADEGIENLENEHEIQKISFLGFSLAGVIFRAAFEHLKAYKNKFHSFVTFSTPHLGCIHSESKLFSMGIWAISKVSNQPIVNELLMNDKSRMKESSLFKLASKDNLKWFDTILFGGSYQDNYSPLESSLIQISERLESLNYIDNIREMSKKIHKSLQNVNVYKTGVNFKISEKSLDTFIGRKAHIEYLENTDLLRTLVYKYNDIFLRYD